jgi:hypothetical protein
MQKLLEGGHVVSSPCLIAATRPGEANAER